MSLYSFLAGLCNGLMGGSLGLGGVSVRAPALALSHTPAAVLARTLAGLVVVVAAWMCRAKVIPLDELAAHLDIVLTLLAGTLAGAWWSAQRTWDWRAVLIGLALVILAQTWDGAAGMLAGVAIGMAMGCDVAASLLLVPAIILLYGLDIKVAGSLALTVSLPLLMVGLARFPLLEIVTILRTERQFVSAASGSMIGAALGTLLLGQLASRIVMPMMEALLVYAAFINLGAFLTKFLHVKS